MLLANVNDAANDFALAAETGAEPPIGRWVNGRILAVLASPELRNSTDVAVGVSVLPAGTSTPRHEHRAEEVAVILSGAGVVEIGAEQVTVRPGSVVRTPPHVPHLTRAADGQPLQVLWIYAPAGSESRWLQDEPEE
jgi:mannose-6-phosphate isomerase-like protein (cupin superfamily)